MEQIDLPLIMLDTIVVIKAITMEQIVTLTDLQTKYPITQETIFLIEARTT